MMKKRLIGIALVFVLLCSIPAKANAYNIVGLDNFKKALYYQSETFTDIAASDWYYANVATVYEYQLMNGTGSKTFSPNGNMTIAEAVTVAVRICSIYYSGSLPYFEEEGMYWYSVYVDLAKDFEIVTSDYPNYNVPATRAQFAEILSKSINQLDFDEINWIDDGAIPDVLMNAEYADAVYMLYRAGVLTGTDNSGTFKPNSTITRAEAAAIITRIVDPSLRKTIELAGQY